MFASRIPSRSWPLFSNLKPCCESPRCTRGRNKCNPVLRFGVGRRNGDIDMYADRRTDGWTDADLDPPYLGHSDDLPVVVTIKSKSVKSGCCSRFHSSVGGDGGGEERMPGREAEPLSRYLFFGWASESRKGAVILPWKIHWLRREREKGRGDIMQICLIIALCFGGPSASASLLTCPAPSPSSKGRITFARIFDSTRKLSM